MNIARIVKKNPAKLTTLLLVTRMLVRQLEKRRPEDLSFDERLIVDAFNRLMEDDKYANRKN